MTGANGFVGQRLVSLLCQQGHSVTAPVRHRPLVALREVRYVEFWDLDGGSAFEWLRGQDAVVHLIGRTHSGDLAAPQARAAYETTNVVLLSRLAEAALAQGVRRFVFLSSIKVLGERTIGRPFRSNDRPAPEDHYGITKLDAENALAEIARDGMEYVVLRPPLVLGPGVKGNLLRLMRLVDRGVPLPLASVDNLRSIVCLDNLCDMIARSIEHPSVAGCTMLAADGTDVSTPALLLEMAAALNVPARLLPLPVPLLGAAARLLGRGADFERVAGSLQVDSTEIRDVLGWLPVTTFPEQMDATARWYRAHGAS